MDFPYALIFLFHFLVTTSLAVTVQPSIEWNPILKKNTIIFEAYLDKSSMEWLCCSCSLPNVASKLLDTTNLSISSVSSISQYQVCCKAKSLFILTANFQSLWNKK